MLDPRTVSGFSKNITLPAGYLFFDPMNDDGSYEGEMLLADCPGFTINVTSESLEDYDADGPIAELNFDHTTKVTRKSTVEVKDMSLAALALFYIGDISSITTTAGPVVASAINGGEPVKAGRWYQLGVSSARPAGVRAIDTLVIKDSVPTTYTVVDDYEQDLETGRIYIVPGGALDGKVVTADFNTTDVAWDQLASNSLGAKRGRLRFIAHNARGTNRDLYAPDVVMSPNGDLAMKSRDTVQKMGFSVAFQKPADGTPALYLNGRAA